MPKRMLRALALVASLAVVFPVHSASRPPVRGEHGMVVSAEPLATRVGADVLRQGGNAVDASVAVAFALAVTFPEAGNLGGGGFLLYRAPDGTYSALDFRETAPLSVGPESFLDDQGRAVPGLSVSGGLAVGVPGTVAGLAEAHRRWGSLPWPRLVDPAIRLAEDGFRVSPRTARSISTRAADLAADPEARAIFLPAGHPPDEGEILARPALAATLRKIRTAGASGFYKGSVAEAVVQTVRRLGGAITLEDLASYRPVLRVPVEASYRGYRVVSFPPPGGGVVLLQTLKMLERFDLRRHGFGSSRTTHWIVEAERRAYADRARWLGDPDFSSGQAARLLDSDYLSSRAASIRKRRATPSRKLAAGSPPVPASTDTTHLSIVDREGGAVALTTTLNSSFGAGIVAAGTGVLLNNEMDDFAVAPGRPNLYGLVGGEANAVQGGKRPLSSMAPTILERDGQPGPALILGSPGGSAIITTVLQVIVNVVDYGMSIQEAVDAPRFHHQWLPDRIDYEARAFPEDVSRALRTMGHRLQERPALGNVSAIGRGDDGAWLGAADPRRGGLAEGY